jgi:RNA polymerase sigma-70 factor (ECF subfamily)
LPLEDGTVQFEDPNAQKLNGIRADRAKSTLSVTPDDQEVGRSPASPSRKGRSRKDSSSSQSKRPAGREVAAKPAECREPEASGKRRSQASVPLAPQSLSDQELIDGILEASQPHFNELYNRYFQRIYNFVYARISNHADTEEIVQETFTIVYSSIGRYSGRSTLLSWVYGIAKNTANNSIRQACNQSRNLKELKSEQLHPSDSFATCTPEEQLNLDRYLKAVRAELRELGAWQAEIFEMRHLQNLSIREISERTDRSSDSIRSSLYRVKRLLMETAEIQSPPATPSAPPRTTPPPISPHTTRSGP